MSKRFIELKKIGNVEICPVILCKRSKNDTIMAGKKIIEKYQNVDTNFGTKIGFAGCKNACGSIHSKDVGVIADDAGFIVMAGGSAGCRSRMADIISVNLSEEKTFRLVESIFDYYKEAADKGERLGVFIDKVGIDNFKEEVLKRAVL